ERRTGAHTESDVELRRATHRTIRDVTAAIEGWSFHTAVAKLHELRTAIDRASGAEHGVHAGVFDESVDALVAMLAPMTPHVTSELWQRRHPDSPDVHQTPWPVADESLLRVERETMVVQVDGKVKDRLDVAPDLTEADAVALALASERVLAALGGAEPSRVVARPPRLVNIVR
ncbi:MAG TPA: class I tRNA ligase family protein, partial [Acidimicrobiales bacterium]|nr:class I tRNA ligase family protein [Acidimicrobiales bacterium]